MANTKIIVGLSGGVDSAVAALLLKEQGYEVTGVFMKNWEEDDTSSHCTATKDLQDAQDVCNKLNIQLHTANFAAEYWDLVFSYFLQEYKANRTPNPDILCNKEIKFKTFLEYAKLLGADFIATGHYATKKESASCYLLAKGIDQNKDQSYFLHALNQEQLKSSIFPLGNYTKQQVRERAKQAGFKNHQKKDSTGICFIGERKFKEFLQQYLPAQPGNIINLDNKVIGKHDGLMYYTIGQRQGIKIGGRQDGIDAPWYVVGKNISQNQLIVAQGNNHPSLFSYKLYASKIHWITGKTPNQKFSCNAKIRYRQKDEPCNVILHSANDCTVSFKNPQRAITPGQSVVFYDGEICLGGGIIEYAIKDQ